MKKRFALFGGSNYYPSGGMNDFRGTFATCREAEDAATKSLHGWYLEWHHVVDLRTMKIVASS